MAEMDSTGPIRPPKVYYELFNRPKHWVPIVERRKNGQLDNGQLGIWGRPVTRLLLYLKICESPSFVLWRIYEKASENVHFDENRFWELTPGK